jgi:hypothetical protein
LIESFTPLFVNGFKIVSTKAMTGRLSREVSLTISMLKRSSYEILKAFILLFFILINPLFWMGNQADVMKKTILQNAIALG